MTVIPFTRQARRAAAIGLIAAAVMLSSCGSTPTTESTTSTTAAGTTTTLDPDAKVVFGRGALPETMPTSFPIPAKGIVGSTMIDRTRSLTEMVMTLPADVSAVVKFYEENLPARGYEVSNSQGTDAKWTMDFSGDGIEGIVSIATAGNGLTSVSISFTSTG